MNQFAITSNTSKSRIMASKSLNNKGLEIRKILQSIPKKLDDALSTQTVEKIKAELSTIITNLDVQSADFTSAMNIAKELRQKHETQDFNQFNTLQLLKLDIEHTFILAIYKKQQAFKDSSNGIPPNLRI